MNKAEATKRVSKNYQDSKQTKILTNSFKPYIKKIVQDINNASTTLDNDVYNLERKVMKTDAAMAYYVFNQVRKYIMGKFPKSSQMPEGVANSIDEMFLWQITAIPKKTYNKKLPSKYMNLCLKIFPEYNNFFNSFGIKTNFKKPSTSITNAQKRKIIKKFLDIMANNHDKFLQVLNRNASRNG